MNSYDQNTGTCLRGYPKSQYSANIIADTLHDGGDRSAGLGELCRTSQCRPVEEPRGQRDEDPSFRRLEAGNDRSILYDRIQQHVGEQDPCGSGNREHEDYDERDSPLSETWRWATPPQPHAAFRSPADAQLNLFVT